MLGFQIMQLRHIFRIQDGHQPADFGQCFSFDLDWPESCNTTFHGLSRAASPFLMLVLQLGHMSGQFPRKKLSVAILSRSNLD